MFTFTSVTTTAYSLMLSFIIRHRYAIHYRQIHCTALRSSTNNNRFKCALDRFINRRSSGSHSDLEVGRNLNSRLHRSTSERNLLDIILPSATPDNIGCTAVASLIDGESTETTVPDGPLDQHQYTACQLPLPDSSRVSISSGRKRYANILTYPDINYNCAVACNNLEDRRPEVAISDCMERFCQRTYSTQRDDAAKMVVKRWGSRVCMETHCRSHQKDAHSYIACGMAYCG